MSRGGPGGGFGRSRQNERPTPVEAADVRIGRISRQLVSSGRLQPRAQATVTAGISGQLQQVSVEIGHDVIRQVGEHVGPYLTIARLSPMQFAESRECAPHQPMAPTAATAPWSTARTTRRCRTA